MHSGKETYRAPAWELLFGSQGTATRAMTEIVQGDLNEPKTWDTGTNNPLQINKTIKN